MKSVRITESIILVLMCVGLIFFVYPYAAPIVLHHPAESWLVSWHDRLVPMKGQPLQQPFVWIVLGLGSALFLTAEIEMRTRKRTTHGSAHHATRREARPYMHHRRTLVGRVQRALRIQHNVPESFLILGRYLREIISLDEHQQESNVLLTAPIGKGKSTRVIIPNLMMERGDRSLCIADVKGELEKKTAGTVSHYHEVWVFAPVKPQQSEGYNPLALIGTYEDADAFATCWVANTGKSGNDEFWAKAAIRLMRITMLHLRVAEPGAALSRVADILVYSTYDRMKRTLTTSPSPKVREEALPLFDFMDKNPKLIGSLMVDTSTRFGILGSDEIRAVTAHNDIDFRAMAERPIALYLSIPARYQSTYQPLLACFMMQMFTTWEERAEEEPTGHLPRRIMCYLDEFANLGYISNLSSYISTARHTGVGLLIVLQSFSQIVEKYGRSMLETLLSNTVTHLLLPGAGKEETEYYSARIGNTTIQTETRNTKGGYSLLGEQQENWTQGETGRRLMTPDELRTMPANDMLMLGSSSAPMVIKTKPYFEERRFVNLTNTPFHPVHIHQESPAPSPMPRSSPSLSLSQQQQPPRVIESNPNVQNKQGNDQFFLEEDE